MNDVMNKIFNILSYTFLILGICGMFLFFALYFKDSEQNALFYCAMISFVVGIALFTIFRRIAHLGMTKIIRSLNSVHQQVEMMNADFQRQHPSEDKEEDKKD